MFWSRLITCSMIQVLSQSLYLHPHIPYPYPHSIIDLSWTQTKSGNKQRWLPLSNQLIHGFFYPMRLSRLRVPDQSWSNPLGYTFYNFLVVPLTLKQSSPFGIIFLFRSFFWTNRSFRRTLHISTLLLMAAMWRGLRPSLLTTWPPPTATVLSPYCGLWRRIHKTRSLRPEATASCRATSPLLLRSHRSAWCWTSKRNVSVWPLVAPQ